MLHLYRTGALEGAPTAALTVEERIENEEDPSTSDEGSPIPLAVSPVVYRMIPVIEPFRVGLFQFVQFAVSAVRNREIINGRRASKSRYPSSLSCYHQDS